MTEQRDGFTVPLYEVDPVVFLRQLQRHFKNALVPDDEKRTLTLTMSPEFAEIVTAGLCYVANKIEELEEARDCR